MSLPWRKFALSVHVLSSVGWFGAVAAFLALAVIGLSSADAATMRAVYVSMAAITWFVVLPLNGLSLVSGLISSLGTTWGLFRHYWVLFKLLLTVFATLVLLVHTRPIGDMARLAIGGHVLEADARAKLQLIVASAAALLVFVVTTVLSIYKPRGVTAYGIRKTREVLAMSSR